ncbi:hypothetical protein GGE68_004848 [Rhizobium leguminosarum]|uniref:hypothetical protein n=1 Tax=Rhizobium leguminosarum TaxID=384 RepID=UPI00160E267D|nr:hypothetical protein [Rhizobium leguminosarum]MBB5666616.1 hypothetical protein [Rhizobium leguminosarum]
MAKIELSGLMLELRPEVGEAVRKKREATAIPLTIAGFDIDLTLASVVLGFNPTHAQPVDCGQGSRTKDWSDGGLGGRRTS